MRQILILLFALSIAPSSFGQLKSPDEYLPHKLGEAFTPHHMLVKYIEHVALNSDKIQIKHYGDTYEGRPLMLCFLSTPENLENMEAIRLNNLRRAGMIEGEIDPELDRAFVWLSFTVHGNEAAGAEAAKEVLYQLVNPANEKTSSWLENTIIMLDPAVNPDGYDRYTSWHRRVANKKADPASFSREHSEPWPGGRTNHYMFDLNRDWAWQTQIESQLRIKLYREWLPHIHADLHEMGINSPYFFAPAAKPYHAYVEDYQKKFQEYIGENHARYFDANGWLYFTEEVFDLLYPSYGDTWPTFNGAIGMTYEQGGSGRAGRAVLMSNGDTLSLKDRIDHHATTSLSTVEVGSERMEELLQDFEEYYKSNLESPKGTYQTFMVKADAQQGKLSAFLDLLDKNGIQYGQAKESASLKGWNYALGENASFEMTEGTIIIPVRQPNGLLAQVLMEPKTEIEDSLTYDITAWALPHAYGLSAHATAFTEDYSPYMEAFKELPGAPSITNPVAEPLAWVLAWESTTHVKVLSQLLQKGIRARAAEKDFELEGTAYPRGTIVIHRADNKSVDKLADLMASFEEPYPGMLRPVTTGLTSKGPDLGSGSFRLINMPRVGLLSGDGTSSNSVGQVWHFFEQSLDMPIHVFPSSNLGRVELEKLDVLILPEGRYSLGGRSGDRINDWVRQGGKLISIGYANRSLEDNQGMSLKAKSRSQGEKETKKPKPSSYQNADRESISYDIPGAVFRLEMDQSHPLSFGLPKYYFSLKTSGYSPELMEDGWNVGIIGEDPYFEGFVGAKAKEGVKGSLVFGVQGKGRGSIVYLIDNPLYRGFWEVGKILFANALFQVN